MSDFLGFLDLRHHRGPRGDSRPLKMRFQGCPLINTFLWKTIFGGVCRSLVKVPYIPRLFAYRVQSTHLATRVQPTLEVRPRNLLICSELRCPVARTPVGGPEILPAAYLDRRRGIFRTQQGNSPRGGSSPYISLSLRLKLTGHGGFRGLGEMER